MVVAIIGVTILLIATAGGLLLARRNAPDQQRQTKVLLFVLYFWVLVFVQLIVVAVGYSMLTNW
ncbi:MAG: hypothetical protein PVG72_02945 [Gammaproteobacteria bacterium]|jgi:hypothetical protein